MNRESQISFEQGGHDFFADPIGGRELFYSLSLIGAHFFKLLQKIVTPMPVNMDITLIMYGTYNINAETQ